MSKARDRVRHVWRRPSKIDSLNKLSLSSHALVNGGAVAYLGILLINFFSTKYCFFSEPLWMSEHLLRWCSHESKETVRLTASSLALAFCSSVLCILKGLNLNFLKGWQLIGCVVKYIPFHKQEFFPWKPLSIILKRHFTHCYHFLIVSKNFRGQEKLNTRAGFCNWLLLVLRTTKMLTVSWIAGICWMNAKCGLTVKCKTNHKHRLNYWGSKPHKVLDK